MLCKCGLGYEGSHLYRKYDDNGDVAIEVCPHGLVVQDDGNSYQCLEDEDFLDTLVKRYSKK